MLRSVETVNRGQIKRTFSKIEQALGGSVEGKTIAVLGLAFKPNTDDVREAPAIHLIDRFVRAGAAVKAHDPIAIDGARAEVGNDITYSVQMYEAINECDVVLLATEWNEYKNIDFRMVRKLMRGNVVYDGRNIFDPEKVVGEGLRYIGVGRSKEPSLSLVRL